MRRIAGVVLITGLVGCGAVGKSSPTFEVRGMNQKTSSTEYGETFTYEGTVVQTAPARDTRDYYVLLQVIRLSGGKAADWPKDTVHVSVIVMRGAGDVTLNGGYRAKPTTVTPMRPEDQWEPARISVRPVGYTPIERVP